MGRVGALPSSGFEPSTLPAPLQEQIQQTLFGIASHQPRPKFGEHRMIKAGVNQFQAECIFPSEPIAYGVSSLAICQVLHKLKYCHKRQAPQGTSRLAILGKQIGKRFIGINRSQRVTHLHEDIATGKHSVSHSSYFFWNWWNG